METIPNIMLSSFIVVCIVYLYFCVWLFDFFMRPSLQEERDCTKHKQDNDH